MEVPVTLSFIAVAAFAHPKTITKNGKLELDSEIAAKTKVKMQYMVIILFLLFFFQNSIQKL